MKVEKRKQITAEALHLDLEDLKQNKPDGGKIEERDLPSS